MQDALNSLVAYGAEQTAKDIAFFTSHFDIIVNRTMPAGGHKEYLGHMEDPCRFCGRSAPEVKFSKIPHTVPELLGNRTLVSHYECDECNVRFGKLEADLGAMTALERLAAQVRGKGGVPSAKSRLGKSRVDMREEGFHIQQYEGDEFLSLNEEDKTLTLTISPQRFRPLAVYKSLLKAALSIVDPEDVAEMPEAIAWLRAEGLTDNVVSDGLKFRLIKSFTPGPSPIRMTRAMVLRLKDESVLAPRYHFVVGSGNSTFQIVLPCPGRDRRLQGTQAIMRPIPIVQFLEGDAVKGATRFGAVSLASTALVAAPASLTFSYESIESGALPDASLSEDGAGGGDAA